MTNRQVGIGANHSIAELHRAKTDAGAWIFQICFLDLILLGFLPSLTAYSGQGQGIDKGFQI